MVGIDEMLKALKEYEGEPVSLMEVCGTHTNAIAKCGIRSLISERIRLISGPGCPVCVTVSSYIDRLCGLALLDSHCVVTFGDMMRVPGAKGSLLDCKAAGGNVRMVYSPFDCLKFAAAEPEKTFVFAAVGFETTTPIYAMMVEAALKNNIRNLKLLTSIKTMPGAIRWICKKNSRIQGLIAPGHVSVMTGSNLYSKIAEENALPFAIAGFEGPQIIAAIYVLLRLEGKGKVCNLYPSAVREEGNRKAAEIVERYFEEGSAHWRGIGGIEGSGLYLREEFAGFDMGSQGITDDCESMGCRCGDVLMGNIQPAACPHFARGCVPEHPVGACMVSQEGACFSAYSYERLSKE